MTPAVTVPVFPDDADVPARVALTDFLTARIAEDEQAAKAAIAPERPGTHWQWETTETDMVVPDSDIQEALAYQSLSLRTVEMFWLGSFDLPAFLINEVEEGSPGALAHIARWDPARVLAECDAKRRIASYCDTMIQLDRDPPQTRTFDAWVVLRALALPYVDHPDFQERWRP